MAINFSKLSYFQNLTANDIPNTYHKWLSDLTAPTIIDFKKEGCDRWRVVTTLLHGNEPSGFIALYQWIKQEAFKDIAVNIRFIVCSVEAAKFEPAFSTRFLSGGKDINRCFGIKSLADYYLRAELIASCIRQVKPEAVVDLHNTSGKSASFCVSCHEDKEHLALATLFCNNVIITDLNIGALMEQNFSCSIVAIECGGALEQTAHDTALRGLGQFCAKENILVDEIDEDFDVFHQPVRFKLNQTTELNYTNTLPDNGVSLRPDIEELNRGITPSGTSIGWVDDAGLSNFNIEDAETHGNVDDYFDIVDNQMFTKCDLRLFMATTNPTIAVHDCLFYFINENKE
ncbi:succinylglutamate desuccinylase/aspartoacylase domain-containing protein [Thalassotalea atypica]|uniref:succinylglutamate desuccinylase/aspartoacylase domain-containing protein n=1 Tax=Thalassotalea atypica TaxID=2054316 RepID=UPI0025731E6D|nr:succinylglutamate desuccinylase/aspartoacylase family protein [Thalassotalea atypica]